MGWNRCIFTFSSLILVTLSSTKVASAAVSVTIREFPETIKIDEPFSLTASVSGLPAGQEFKYKVGIATTSTYYGYGQVKKDDIFIGYNDANSCDTAPTKNVDDKGFWNGKITAKVNRNAKTGDGKIRFKVCDPDKTSPSYPVILTEPDPLPVVEEETLPTPPTPPPTIYRLPATLSAIPISRIFGQATVTPALPVTSSHETLTSYFKRGDIIFAIIAIVGFVFGFLMFPKVRKKGYKK